MLVERGFLDAIGATRGPLVVTEAGPITASRLPTCSPAHFMFATGIECSNPTIRHGRVRRDQLEECGHYDRWQEDLALVRELGLKFLRYGLPYHKVHVAPGVYDWSFADLAMAEMQRLGITPILDLLHFGVPDWLGNFQNPELPAHFADYAQAVAQRYPWVRYWTPVNEIYVTAKLSTLDAMWNEQIRTDHAFVTALKHLVAACKLACDRIVALRPDAVIVHSESAEYIHEARLVQTPRVTLANKQRFISLDLLFGNPPDADVLLYLMDNGLTREEYAWFMRGEPAGYQVLGLDYYGRNEFMVRPDGRKVPAEDVLGWHLISEEYFRRYKKPLMHTETNVFDPKAATAWLWKQWLNILKTRADGVPVLGFTWYSLIDQIDWDIGLSRKRGKVNGCGLYNLERKPNPVAAEYRALLEEFGEIPAAAQGDLFETTGQPSRLPIAA
jgi:beta-glucosidase/6-phospho-beta-glucosidase/beta-galactosidase